MHKNDRVQLHGLGIELGQIEAALLANRREKPLAVTDGRALEEDALLGLLALLLVFVGHRVIAQEIVAEREVSRVVADRMRVDRAIEPAVDEPQALLQIVRGRQARPVALEVAPWNPAVDILVLHVAVARKHHSAEKIHNRELLVILDGENAPASRTDEDRREHTGPEGLGARHVRTTSSAEKDATGVVVLVRGSKPVGILGLEVHHPQGVEANAREPVLVAGRARVLGVRDPVLLHSQPEGFVIQQTLNGNSFAGNRVLGRGIPADEQGKGRFALALLTRHRIGMCLPQKKRLVELRVEIGILLDQTAPEIDCLR